jgi:hypothetical protein
MSKTKSFLSRLAGRISSQSSTNRPSAENGQVNEAVGPASSVGVDFDVPVINEDALLWARTYDYASVPGLTESTRATLREAIAAFISTPGMTNGQLRALLEPAFGPEQAQMIAVTEVTRAYSQGEQIHQKDLANRGMKMTRLWRTCMDEKVCPICSPLEDKPEEEWQAILEGLGLWPPDDKIKTTADMPPGHVGCRCSSALSFVG